MIPSDFEDSNAEYNLPTSGNGKAGPPLKAFLGRLPGDSDGAPVRVVTRWRPIREEVEGLMQGASIWLHVMGEHMPAVAIGCFDPFKPVVQTGAAHGRPIDAGDPLELVDSLAAMDVLRALFKAEGLHPEEVVERVVKYVHAAEKMKKGLGG